jgi:hypothetical protein
MPAAASTTIETTTCGRCGGGGRYSFNLRHGSVCYGCGGSGRQHTPRGRVAARFLEDLRSRRVDEIAVGDIVRYDQPTLGGDVAKVWATVEAIGSNNMTSITNGVRREIPMVSLDCRGRAGRIMMHLDGASMIRKGFTAVEKQAQLREACAFQDTLDARGRARTRRAA